MNHVTVIIDPTEVLSLSAYGHLKSYMPYHQAVKLVLSAVEYYISVGVEYLYELDAMVYDELGYIEKNHITLDVIAATVNVIVMRVAPKIKMLLGKYLADNNGAISLISMPTPTQLHIVIELNTETAGIYEPTPAWLNRLISERIQEVINANDALYHRDLCCLIAGLKPVKT